MARAATPSGGQAAGRPGLGILCLTARMPAGFDALDTNWRVAQEIAAEHGRRRAAVRNMMRKGMGREAREGPACLALSSSDGRSSAPVLETGPGLYSSLY